MRYLALACDYDETLTCDGRVDNETIAALVRFLASGRRLILVTGRMLGDLVEIFPQAILFDSIVAENGCVLYRPPAKTQKRLAQPPPANFISELRRRKVEPLDIGAAIVATRSVHQLQVLDVIRQLGLDLQVVLNRGAAMVLPVGTDKATGLAAALREMALSPDNVVGVGDAENDLAFLSLCACSVAVANALPTIQESVDFVTRLGEGAGVCELIDEIVATDLRARERVLTPRRLDRRLSRPLGP